MKVENAGQNSQPPEVAHPRCLKELQRVRRRVWGQLFPGRGQASPLILLFFVLCAFPCYPFFALFFPLLGIEKPPSLPWGGGLQHQRRGGAFQKAWSQRLSFLSSEWRSTSPFPPEGQVAEGLCSHSAVRAAPPRRRNRRTGASGAPGASPLHSLRESSPIFKIRSKLSIFRVLGLSW